MHHHEHSHHHGKDAVPATDQERSIALLQYMIDHNRSHAEELEELADGLSENVATMVRDAIGEFNHANEMLVSALDVLKGE